MIPTPEKRIAEFESLGFGMFVHWGLYSQLGMGEWTYHIHKRDMEEYKKTMIGIYTTSVNEFTLDEAPMAYKSLDDIIDVIKESVDIIEVLKPIYNFKANQYTKQKIPVQQAQGFY